MSNYISLNIDNIEVDISKYQDLVSIKHSELHNRTGLGSEYLGWLDLPSNYDNKELDAIIEAAKLIREQSEVVVVVGIGGSYLGVRTGVEMMKHNFANDIQVLYAGHHLSSNYLNELLEYLRNKDFSLIVVSKSGTTTEPAIAFRFLKKLLEEKYENSSDRIYAVTDKEKGALRKVATQEGYRTFVIPDNIGGRYSILTPCGLLGMAVAGVDIREVMLGAKLAYDELLSDNINENLAYQYSLIRNVQYLERNKSVEIMVNYEPSLFYFNEWWKQLFGESDGKDGRGLFPTSASFSTDLHSLGQYIQDGERLFFETIINVIKPKKDLIIENDKLNLDGLNYLSGKSVSYVNQMAFEGTLDAHLEGNVPAMVLSVPDLSEKTLGYLVYFFEKACAMSGYIIGVNPFNQPGVEQYKKNMFSLLGKPGF
ncbi:glucose-6-phosphate isomerase [Mycoplasmatota bacterium zrk1]